MSRSDTNDPPRRGPESADRQGLQQFLVMAVHWASLFSLVVTLSLSGHKVHDMHLFGRYEQRILETHTQATVVPDLKRLFKVEVPANTGPSRRLEVKSTCDDAPLWQMNSHVPGAKHAQRLAPGIALLGVTPESSSSQACQCWHNDRDRKSPPDESEPTGCERIRSR